MGLINVMDSLFSWQDTIVDILTYICLWLDDVIYSVVAALYEIFISFTQINILEQFPALASLGDRIMLLVGIFMLFVVAFSLIQYLLDPNKLTDQAGGAMAIVKNIFISLAMIVAINPVFNLLYDLQKIVVDGGIMEKIVLGSSYNTNNKLTAKDIGQNLALISWLSFFNVENGASCATVATGTEKTADCGVLDGVLAKGIKGSMENADVIDTMKANSVVYNPVFSTIGGIFLVCILLSFTVDVGIRVFKLLIYQFLAPIAIFSYINPKTQSVFNNWIKNVISTYLDLFIRILAVFFAIVLISNLSFIIWGDGNPSSLAKLTGLSQALAFFLLMAAIFAFAKMIPKLIGDMFGIDLGDSTINPFKKAGLGGILGGGIGGLVGGIGGAVTGGIIGGPLGAVGGLARGTAGGMKNGVRSGGFGKAIGAGINASKKSTAGVAKSIKAGGFTNRALGSAANAMGVTQRKQNKLDRAKSGIQNLESAKKSAERDAARKFTKGTGRRINSLSDYQALRTESYRNRLSRYNYGEVLTTAERKDYTDTLDKMFADKKIDSAQRTAMAAWSDDQALSFQIAHESDLAEADFNDEVTAQTRSAMNGTGSADLVDNLSAAKDDFYAAGLKDEFEDCFKEPTSVQEEKDIAGKSILNRSLKSMKIQENALEDNPTYKAGKNSE